MVEVGVGVGVGVGIRVGVGVGVRVGVGVGVRVGVGVEVGATMMPKLLLTAFAPETTTVLGLKLGLAPPLLII